MCLFYQGDQHELTSEYLRAKFTHRSLLPMIKIKGVAGENEYKVSETQLLDSGCMFNLCNKVVLGTQKPTREEFSYDTNFEKSFEDMDEEHPAYKILKLRKMIAKDKKCSKVQKKMIARKHKIY